MFRPAQNITSEAGEEFTPDTKVKFYLKGDLETGTVIKQMRNSAIVEINETDENEDIMFQTHGNVVISYKDLKLKQLF